MNIEDYLVIKPHTSGGSYLVRAEFPDEPEKSVTLYECADFQEAVQYMHDYIALWHLNNSAKS